MNQNKKSKRHFGITLKILGFGALLLLLTVGSLGYLSWKIGQQSDFLSHQMEKQAVVVEEQQAALQNQTTALGNFESVQTILRTFSEYTYWLTDLSVSWLNESEDRANVKLKELNSLLKNLEQHEATIVAEIRPLLGKYHDTMLQSVDAYADDNRVLGNSLLAGGRNIAAKISKKLQSLLEKAKHLSSEAQKNANVSSNVAAEAEKEVIANNTRLRTASFVMMFFAFLVCGILSFVFARSIAKPLIAIMETLGTGAKKSNTTSSRLKDIADGVAASSNEQASAVQESVASMAEMRSMIAQTVDNARVSLELAQKVSERTEEGGRIMESMVSSMESIQQANVQLQEMANIIDQISAKTGVINDIVFKTQLLAFNASIEAARAGQHGRGFAVVAEEVGNLAEMSGTAATEIQVLLDDSKTQVNSIVANTEKRVSDGQAVSQDALETFNEISKEVYNISSQIQSINDATREQEQGIEQTTQAMTEMDNISQQNSATAQQATGYADQMTSQSKELGNIVEVLRLLVFGSGRGESVESHVPRQNGQETDIIQLSDDHILSDDAQIKGFVNEFAQSVPSDLSADDDEFFAPLN